MAGGRSFVKGPPYSELVQPLDEELPYDAVDSCDRQDEGDEGEGTEEQSTEPNPPPAIGGFTMQAADEDQMERTLRELRFAEEQPVIRGLRADPDGRLWIQRWDGSPWGPAPIDIVAADGRYLGTLRARELPDAVGSDGRVAWIEEDELGVQGRPCGSAGTAERVSAPPRPRWRWTVAAGSSCRIVEAAHTPGDPQVRRGPRRRRVLHYPRGGRRRAPAVRARSSAHSVLFAGTVGAPRPLRYQQFPRTEPIGPSMAPAEKFRWPASGWRLRRGGRARRGASDGRAERAALTAARVAPAEVLREG